MKSIFCVNSINTRWDFISRFETQYVSNIPFIKSLTVHLHEAQPRSYKDRHILALFLELITAQRVSPRILTKGSYFTKFSVKRARKDIQTQVTLRRSNLFFFMDRWVLLSLGKINNFNNIRNLSIDKQGGVNFYHTDIFSFFELDQLGSFIDRCNGLQFHIQTSTVVPTEVKFLLASITLPIEKEGPLLVDSIPNLNFFNK